MWTKSFNTSGNSETLCISSFSVINSNLWKHMVTEFLHMATPRGSGKRQQNLFLSDSQRKRWDLLEMIGCWPLDQGGCGGWPTFEDEVPRMLGNKSMLQTFSKKQFSKCINQHKEVAKEHGCTPWQNKSKMNNKKNGKKLDNPSLSLLLLDTNDETNDNSCGKVDD